MWAQVGRITFWLLLFNMGLVFLMQWLSNASIVVAAPNQTTAQQGHVPILIDPVTGVRTPIHFPQLADNPNPRFAQAMGTIPDLACNLVYIINDGDTENVPVVARHIMAQQWRMAHAHKPAVEEWYIDNQTAAPSPDGQWIFLPSASAGIVLNIETNEQFDILPQQVLNTLPEQGYWSPDSRYLIWPFAKDFNILWYRFDTQTHAIAVLELPGFMSTIHERRAVAWSPDSRTFATLNRVVTGDDENDKANPIQLLLLDAETMQMRTLHSFRAAADTISWQPDGPHIVLVARITDPNGRRFTPFFPYLIHSDNGEVTQLVRRADLPIDPDSNFDMANLSYIPFWSPDGQSVQVVTMIGSRPVLGIQLAIINMQDKTRMTYEIAPPFEDLFRFDIANFVVESSGRGVQRYYSFFGQDAQDRLPDAPPMWMLLFDIATQDSTIYAIPEQIETILTPSRTGGQFLLVARDVHDWRTKQFFGLDPASGLHMRFALEQIEAQVAFNTCT